MKRKSLALFLALVLCLSLLAFPASASSTGYKMEQSLAESLYALHLFKGMSDAPGNPDFALDKSLTREQAITMMIRILGKENEALSGNWSHPFTDVSPWAQKYVGYAYEKGLTNGISATQFGTGKVQANMYITFVLRALGYSDKGENSDFSWNFPFSFARQVGLINGWVDTSDFRRADAVTVSYSALNSNLKGSIKKLSASLIEAGVFTAAEYAEYYDAKACSEYEEAPVKALSSQEIYSKCSPSVFYIEVYDEFGCALATGSGSFIDSNGTAVTNFHVIDGAWSAEIQTTDGMWYTVDCVLDYSVEEDWALLRIEKEANVSFPALEIGNGTNVLGGAAIYTIGSPLGLDNTIANGIISNPGRSIDGVRYIQFTAPISHGSSGGALLNSSGELIGITSATFESGQNLNLAIPIEYVHDEDENTTWTLSFLANMMYNDGPGEDYGNEYISPIAVENLTYTKEANGDVWFNFDIVNYSGFTLTYVDFTIRLEDEYGMAITNLATGSDVYTISYSGTIEPWGSISLETTAPFEGGWDYEGTTSFTELYIEYEPGGYGDFMYIDPEVYYGYWDALY